MILLAGGLLALITVGILWVRPPRWLVGLIARLDPDVLYVVRTERKAVALTIDDGPHPDVTPLILQTLREHGARATFFIIGQNIPGNESLLDRIVQDGNELGNHDLADRLTVGVAGGQRSRDLEQVDSMLRAFGPVRWFRPGMGWVSRSLVEEAGRLGYRVALGSVYPHDAHIHDVGVITRLVTSRIYPGAILILHDGRADRVRTVTVLARVLPVLRQRGYAVVTLSDLVAPGTEIIA